MNGKTEKNCFLSVSLTEEVEEVILNIQANLKETIKEATNVKWTKGEKLHCTLGVLEMRNDEQARTRKACINSVIESLGGEEMHDAEASSWVLMCSCQS